MTVRRLLLSRPKIMERAINMLLARPVPPSGDAARPIGYRNDDSGQLGGDDPTEPGCWDWSYGGRVPTADCVGLALWCCGIARRQPGYHGTRGEWLNCASMVDDAHGSQVFFELIAHADAEPGDLLITREHVGVIIRPATVTDGEVVFDHLVVDCSPRHSGRPWSRPAVGTGGSWSRDCVVLRVKV